MAMKPVTPIPPPRPTGTPCPDRIEVPMGEQNVPAATVKAWIAHLRTHGWTDADIPLIWLMRARHGVDR